MIEQKSWSSWCSTLPARGNCHVEATNQVQPTRMSATWQAQIELRSRILADGPSDIPVAALPMAQRAAALAVTAWFGQQNADFITLHVDPGVRVKTLFGERELLFAQGMAFWIRGEGTLDDKTVDETWTVTPVR